jgi:hypothetical protein
MEEGAIPGDIHAEKVGNLEVLYDLDQVVLATAEVRASPWRLGVAYGAATGSRDAGQRE